MLKKKLMGRKYSLLIIGFICTYFLVGMITGFLGAKEIYPFFSWNLFSYVPNMTSEYAIIVYEYDDITLSPPQLYQQAKGILRQSNSITAYYLIQDFGRAYENKERGEAERLQKLFEANYIEAPAKYRLIRIFFNPLERWKTGKYQIINIKDFAVDSL